MNESREDRSQDLLESLEDYAKATGAMERTAALRKMEAVAKEALEEDVEDTNEEFSKMRQLSPEQKQFCVYDCVFTRYIKSSEFVFPANLIKRSEALREQNEQLSKDKKEAKENGSAVVIVGSNYAKGDKQFKVSVLM